MQICTSPLLSAIGMNIVNIICSIYHRSIAALSAFPISAIMPIFTKFSHIGTFSARKSAIPSIDFCWDTAGKSYLLWGSKLSAKFLIYTGNFFPVVTSLSGIGCPGPAGTQATGSLPWPYTQSSGPESSYTNFPLRLFLCMVKWDNPPAISQKACKFLSGSISLTFSKGAIYTPMKSQTKGRGVIHSGFLRFSVYSVLCHFFRNISKIICRPFSYVLSCSSEAA